MQYRDEKEFVPISTKVKRARKGAGLGLFAEEPIKKDTFVIEYTGKKVPSKVADDLGTKYLFEIDEKWTIDGSPRSNKARYINHSCNPNCEAEIFDDERVLIYSLRNIKAGEELTYDYGKEYFDDFIKPIGCKCDSCVKKETRNKKQKKGNAHRR